MPMRDTKQEIAMVYMRLADSRDPDKITVKDLVTACSISRQAFYYYFRDILEVPEWIIDEHFKEALQDALEAETPMGAVLAFTDIFYKNGRFIRRLENSERYAFMQRASLITRRIFFKNLWRTSCRICPFPLPIRRHGSAITPAALLATPSRASSAGKRRRRPLRPSCAC